MVVQPGVSQPEDSTSSFLALAADTGMVDGMFSCGQVVIPAAVVDVGETGKSPQPPFTKGGLVVAGGF
jgi:hypothetical protein